MIEDGTLTVWVLVVLSQKVAVSGPVESVFVEIHISLGAEMNHRRTDDSESRFTGYVEGLASVIGHKDREEPLRHYCTGLLMPCERKSVEPMAAITAPDRTAAQHQSLLHFIGEGKWSDEKVLAKVREMVLPQIERHGAIVAWIIDDTGFPKQGRHSSGTQAGGRAWTFRRPRMARLPPPRHDVHRDLRLPGLRAGDDSPLRTSSRQAVRRTCRSRRLPTPRRRRCGPSATFQIRSPPCADA